MPRNPVLIIKAPILYTVVSALPVADESIKRSPRTPIAQGQLPKEPPPSCQALQLSRSLQMYKNVLSTPFVEVHGHL